MCFHNFTQHSGCGHIGESYTQAWTLCDAALCRLNSLRGPNSPVLSPPVNTPFVPPKRSSSARRFLSLSGTLSRSSTSASTNSRRNTSGPPRTSRTSTSTFDAPPVANPAAATLDYATLPDHQLLAVRCMDPTMRTQVSRDMDVCKSCKRWIVDMQHMLARYEKTGSIKGTSAFEEFLNVRAEVGGGAQGKEEGSLRRGGSIGKAGTKSVEGDVTVPLRDSVMGVDIGARQAIILGYPEEDINGGWRGGLDDLERDVMERRRMGW